MPPEDPSMPQPQTLMTDIAFGESPRWYEDRLWFSDWGAQEILAVDLDGKREVIVQVRFRPFRCASIGSRTGACLLSRHARGFYCAGSPTARWSPTPT